MELRVFFRAYEARFCLCFSPRPFFSRLCRHRPVFLAGADAQSRCVRLELFPGMGRRRMFVLQFPVSSYRLVLPALGASQGSGGGPVAARDAR